MTRLPYGTFFLDLEVPPSWRVIEPLMAPGLSAEGEALRDALLDPLGTPSLPFVLQDSSDLCIVIPDITRPAPAGTIVRSILGFVPPSMNTSILVGTGCHRACTSEELDLMLGTDITGRYQVINHDAFDPGGLKMVGQTPSGLKVWLNKAYAQASRRISVSLIEPHFFAGFSGGPKAVVPGVAGIETILGVHSAPLIGHPGSTWGCLVKNPVYAAISEACGLVPPHLSVNVTTNKNREITGVFAGEVYQAHWEGSASAKRVAMRPVTDPFDIVITTNGGWPLDQNLYQTVKGLSAALQILKPGGSIVCVSECRFGLPAGGNFEALLKASSSLRHLRALVENAAVTQVDQWEAQVLYEILERATVYLKSRLSPGEAAAAFLHPVECVEEGIALALQSAGPDPAVAVLPQGPFTIPYVDKPAPDAPMDPARR
ncbi:MAG: nickel-dependent lactate racemase [Bacillota bacterium]